MQASDTRGGSGRANQFGSWPKLPTKTNEMPLSLPQAFRPRSIAIILDSSSDADSAGLGGNFFFRRRGMGNSLARTDWVIRRQKPRSASLVPFQRGNPAGPLSDFRKMEICHGSATTSNLGPHASPGQLSAPGWGKAGSFPCGQCAANCGEDLDSSAARRSVASGSNTAPPPRRTEGPRLSQITRPGNPRRLLIHY
jgi:hypothetical protein